MQKAFVCLITEPQSVKKVLDEVKNVQGVEEANMVFGGYDLCFNLKKGNMDSLQQTLSKKIATIKDVRATLTLINGKPE